jgi:hypothetical protein
VTHTKHQYEGYLKPWLRYIHASYQAGQTAAQIANAICEDMEKNPGKLTDPYCKSHGIIPQPSSSMVYYVLERTRPDLVKLHGQEHVVHEYPTEARWRLVLPPALANAQGRWERTRAIYNMRKAGFSLVDVAQRFGLSTERVRQLTNSHLARQPAPLERYLNDDTPLRELATACGIEWSRVYMYNKGRQNDGDSS